MAYWGESRQQSQGRPVPTQIRTLPPSRTIYDSRSSQGAVLGPTALLASCGTLLEIVRPHARPTMLEPNDLF